LTLQAFVQVNHFQTCVGKIQLANKRKNVCYNKIVTVYFSNALGQATPLSVVSLGYQGNVPNTPIYTWELWGSSTPQVNLDGITALLNVTFQALDIGQTYVSILNIPVTASGPPPTTTSIPAPYATPRGFSQDITNFLAPTNTSEVGVSKTLMFNNINVPGAANGTVTAAQSHESPDYWYVS